MTRSSAVVPLAAMIAGTIAFGMVAIEVWWKANHP